MMSERRLRAAGLPHSNRNYWLLLLGVVLAGAASARTARAGFCSATARTQLTACRGETIDTYSTAIAICLNESNSSDRAKCNQEAATARDEMSSLCEDQLAARIAVCKAIGEGRYDPNFDEANFVNDFRHPGVTNPYLPLAIGNTWDYKSQAETGHIEVLGDTKLIDDVTCLVVRDQVSVDGRLKEDTDDWFAVARNGGDVWYCGEEVKDYEVFEGDQPQNLELTRIDGSFKVDRDGAKPGIFVPAKPVKGKTFRQEYSLGNAEDIVNVLETQYVYGKRPELDALVPKDLANLLCGAGCVVTGETSPVEPTSFARKYYAPGIGVFLEVTPATGETNRLVDCNFDSRCKKLPKP
jgi:hypothetical protein